MRAQDRACVLNAKAGASFVMMCTGLHNEAGRRGRHSIDEVAVKGYSWGADGEKMKVKASGGVRTLEACLEMLKVCAGTIGI
jgi:deoxyribose-phosphate aldolase